MAKGSPPSLVSSLVRAAALWAVPGLIVVTLALGLISRNSSYQSFDEPLESAVLFLIASAEADDDGTLRLSRALTEPRYQRALSGRYWVIGTVEGDREITPIIYRRDHYMVPLCQSRALQLRL